MITFTGLSVIDLIMRRQLPPGAPELGIDDQHAVVGNQHGRVPATAEHHVEAIVDLDRLGSHEAVELEPHEARRHQHDRGEPDQDTANHRHLAPM